ARDKHAAAPACAAEVKYFHQVGDPYSHLAAQCLARLAADYRIKIASHLVPPPDDTAAPERERLKAYARRDAARLARRYGLFQPNDAGEPAAESVRIVTARLAKSIERGTFADEAPAVGESLWSGRPHDAAAADRETAERMLAEGERLRRGLGHYLGATFYFDGEWYWGVDRLHDLEGRLRAEGFARDPSQSLIAPLQDLALDGPRARKSVIIEFWYSYRSPYVYIAVPRLRRMAEHYGAEIRWRFIIPMIMRGLPVSPAKTLYIMRDSRREGAHYRINFGNIVDPVGSGSDRVTAVTHLAVQLGKGAEFTELGLRAVFHDGLDLSTDDGLLKLAKSAGLSETDMEAALADESWRTVAEENRNALFDAGLWGAPTYRVNGGPAHWGQDRLWALEEDLKAAIASE
ncbi:MAG TPA: DsbA family protein, partial [Candidatus Binataceae bacterium]|nr:DsbA family protein [Candidatus Binataceae bacterium]